MRTATSDREQGTSRRGWVAGRAANPWRNRGGIPTAETMVATRDGLPLRASDGLPHCRIDGCEDGCGKEATTCLLAPHPSAPPPFSPSPTPSVGAPTSFVFVVDGRGAAQCGGLCLLETQLGEGEQKHCGGEAKPNLPSKFASYCWSQSYPLLHAGIIMCCST
jgi:hypothetical protein